MRLTFGILLSFFLLKTAAQQKLNIPEFKNLNPEDNYPTNTILSSYTSLFDIVISLKAYSAWGPDYHIKILAHHVSGWYKIEINTDEKNFDPYTICLSTYKINDSIGNIVWDTLNQNHLFDMKDERGNEIEFCPPIIEETSTTDNGKNKLYLEGLLAQTCPNTNLNY